MQHRYLVFLFLFFALSAHAQDVIVTQYGDTINKKIIYSTKRYLFYVDSNYYGKYFVKGIKKSRMTSSQMNVYKVDRQTAMMNQRAQDVMGNAFMLQGGVQVSYTPFIPDSNATSSEKDFLRHLSIGISYNASFHLRMRPHSFIGVVIDGNQNSAFAEKLELRDASGTINYYTNIKMALGMLYFGPEFMLFRDSKKFKSFFILSAGLGYTRFDWSVRAGAQSPETLRLSGLGIRISVAKTWAIGRTIILGPNIKFVNAIAGSSDAGIVMIPRLNLGLTILVH
ncbi:hypothetical protein BH11BAC1_BH11BAC1_20630 [soil metagenome]